MTIFTFFFSDYPTKLYGVIYSVQKFDLRFTSTERFKIYSMKKITVFSACFTCFSIQWMQTKIMKSFTVFHLFLRHISINDVEISSRFSEPLILVLVFFPPKPAHVLCVHQNRQATTPAWKTTVPSHLSAVIPAPPVLFTWSPVSLLIFSLKYCSDFSLFMF